MDVALVPAVAALAGSAIGALASFASTWLTQHAQVSAQRVEQAMARREHLFGEFIEEAASVYSDALIHENDDPSKLVRLYSLVGKLRLFASSKVISNAEDVLRRIVETYHLPNPDLHNLEVWRDKQKMDVLRAFSEACRDDLRV